MFKSAKNIHEEKCFKVPKIYRKMSSFDSECCELLRPLPRRHSWPEAVQTLKPSTSGIFEPLHDQEEIALRSSMTSRSSNHSAVATTSRFSFTL